MPTTFPAENDPAPDVGAVSADIVSRLNAVMAKLGRNGDTNSASVDRRVALLEAAGTRVEDEGATVVAAAKALNFAGAGVTVTDAGSGEATVTIPGGGTGSGSVDTAATYVWTGRHEFRGVTVHNEAVDVRDSRFNGGAKFDNVVDDTVALQSAINHAGNTATARAGRLIFPEGTAYITDTLLYERRALQVQGQGWGPTGAPDGTAFRWGGPNTKPMMRIRQGMGMDMRDFRLLGNKTAANRPTAGIDLNVDADTQTQPNTFMTFDRIWFGPFTGYDEASLPTAGDYLAKGIMTSGDEPAEDNLQNDMIRIGGCVFFKCGHGYYTWTTPPGNTQAVINKIQSCFFYYCGVGILSVAQIMTDNTYFAFSSVADLHVFQDRFSCFNHTSEYAARMAIIENNGELIVHTGYFQIGEKTHADGKVILAVNDTRSLVDLSYFDFRYNDTLYAGTHSPAGVLTPPKAVSIKAASNGTLAHKILNLNYVNWGVGGVRQAIAPAQLDIDPGRGGNGADDLTITGWVQGPPDASGAGLTTEVYNYLNWKNPTADFSRNDRINQDRVKAGIPADADYLNAPPNGTRVIDSTNNRLYVRVGGVWKYTALT
jgi:hypothetical protein